MIADRNEPHGTLDTTDYIGPDASLLIVADDGPFLRRLARAMETR